MSLKFGTSGLRGLSTELVGSASYIYAVAFARFLMAKKLAFAGQTPVLIGQDFRPSSPQIAAQIKRALSDCGLKPVDCGLIPTPALAYYGLQQGLAAMMITGSHIPADRNGIKFYLPTGEISKEDEQAIVAHVEGIEDPNPVSANGAAPDEIDNQSSDKGEAIDVFMARNKAFLAKDCLAGLRVGVYQHSTVARDMLVDILTFYGADVVPLGRSQTFIPVDTEAVCDDTRQSLKKWASDYQLSALVSADGDGDRPLIADEKGEPINGDLCGFMAAMALKANRIVTPITSNSAIEARFDGAVARTKVGSPFVISAMQKLDSDIGSKIVGFEANGGTLTGSAFEVENGIWAPLPTRDCFLPILAVLATAVEHGKSLSQLKADLAMKVTAADRLTNYPTEKSVALMQWLEESRTNLMRFIEPLGSLAFVNALDGLRVTLNDGNILHFRPSGNAPEMRCYVEADTTETAAHLLQGGLQLVSDFTHPT